MTNPISLALSRVPLPASAHKTSRNKRMYVEYMLKDYATAVAEEVLGQVMERLEAMAAKMHRRTHRTGKRTAPTTAGGSP